MPLQNSINSTNARLSVLTFILLIAVIWTFSLSSSDPSLNLPAQIPQDPQPYQFLPPTLPLPTPTAADFDSELPLPANPDPTAKPIALPPPPELDNPPPAPAPDQQTPPPDDPNYPDANNNLPNPPETTTRPNRTLIVYAYAESKEARENLKFFVAKGLHSAADFAFIFNGNDTASVLIPDLPNIRIFKRPNTCYDLGAIGEILTHDGLWKQYTRFITMNASIRGPFLPIWTNACWTDLYLNRVTETTKLVGMTLNCKPRPHIQSMIFATDAVGMAVLLDPEMGLAASVNDQFGKTTDPVGLSGCYGDHDKAVHAEVGTTGLINHAGYQVEAMMAAMHSEAGPIEYCLENPGSGDVLFNGAYFGSNVHPYETVFIKANRDVDQKLLTAMTNWHLKMKTTSFDTCGVA